VALLRLPKTWRRGSNTLERNCCFGDIGRDAVNAAAVRVVLELLIKAAQDR
jgi:hypothetical protein